MYSEYFPSAVWGAPGGGREDKTGLCKKLKKPTNLLLECGIKLTGVRNFLEKSA